MKLSGAGKCAGVIGWPVNQAFSPRLHGYWLTEYGIDGALVPLAVRPEDFSTVIEGLRLSGFKGASITMPHKEAAFALAHSHGDAAEAAGAANLLVFREDGTIEGHNTDAHGLAASITEVLGNDALKGKKVVLLGAGGAARAAVVALNELGVSHIDVINRHVARAEALVAALAPRVHVKLSASGFSDWEKAAPQASLLVNATSAGMKNLNILDLQLDPLPLTAAVCDVVHTPLETDLLKRARIRGHKTIDGLGMLMHQGVPQFQAFYGIEPKVTPHLRSTLEKQVYGG
jgi:shikimate dehydrogenase